MKKTITLLMLIAVMIVSACSSSGDGGKNTNKETASPTSSGNATNAPEATEDVLSGTKPQLRQLQPFDRFDPNTYFTAGFLEEKTGYKTTYDMLPEELPNEKLNLLMSNREKYDIMRLTKEQFFTLAEAGALEPLNDLIDKYGSNLKAGIEDTTWSAATIDGKIYAIPQGGTGIYASSSLVIRKDWLEELQLEVPTNRDELYNVLKVIKEKKGVIPFTGTGQVSVIPEIASTFGIANTLTNNAWLEVDGGVIHQAEHPRMKEYLTFMNKLYKEGLLDSEWPINTSSVAIERFTSGQSAMMSLAWWSAPSVVNALKKNFPDADFVTLPFLKDEQGVSTIGVNTGITYFMAIPKWSENKEHAMNYMNVKLEKDLFKEIVIGQEGVHHKFEDGKYFPILPAFDDLNNASYYLTGVDESVYSTYWQARVRKDPILFNYFEELQQLADGLFVIDRLSNAPPIASISENSQKLTKFSNDTYLQFIAGTASLDTFDSYLAKWKADGGDAMNKDANEWFSTQK